MFCYFLTNFFEKYPILYTFFFNLLFIFINKVNIPFNANFPFRIFNNNIESIHFFAKHSESPEKFFDLYLDYSEIYFLMFNENIEIFTLLNIFTRTFHYRLIILFCCFYFYFYF